MNAVTISDMGSHLRHKNLYAQKHVTLNAAYLNVCSFQAHMIDEKERIVSDEVDRQEYSCSI